MKVIATYNIKGGVGKTATAVNLAWLAAHEGAPSLVWDLDPQGAASYYFRIKPKIKGGGKRLVQGKRDLEKFIRGTDFDLLDLLPADFSYRNMDIFLEGTKKPSHQLYKLLKQFRNEYEYVFLDCPPSISLVSENIFDATTAILVPTIPTILSLRTYKQIQQFFKKHDLDTTKILPFFCMTDRRKKMHRSMVETPPDFLTNLMPTSIPYDSKVEQMGIHRAPLVEFAPNARAARCYEALWSDIKQHLSRLE
ncbi:MAG: cobyrinic acid a,c-diamide synthase [Gammaproteobacteria bacterium]|jgi:cellulose biosynthesis protein BcsQ|nr:cobyrinic acid a,c-diamide synthase [Gammaproteobacteria bacterium]|tara:strand:- start:823 stop:1575 length:753 start_codon:yes stop_codon:yes gene_type:complete